MKEILFPILTFFAGAVIQYFFSILNEKRTILTGNRIKAYSDYLLLVNRKSSLIEDAEKSKNLAEISDAKYRICIYGSNEVVDKLSEFEGQNPSNNEEEQRKLFFNLCNAMRQDAGNEKVLDDKIFHKVMFGHVESIVLIQKEKIVALDLGSSQSNNNVV